MKKLIDKLKQIARYQPKEEQLMLQHFAGSANTRNEQLFTKEVPMDNILTLAQKLITIRSTSDNRDGLQEAIRLIGEQVTEFTIEPFIASDKPSLLIHNSKPGTKRFKIILNAHLDVVAGKDQQFKPYVKNGKLYGRGAYDMKATAAVMVFLFKKLAKQLSYPLALQIVTDEEIVLGAGTRMQLEKGVKTNFAIIGECGSNLDIIYGNKGVVHATITTSGIGAHGAYPWKGKNAITKMHEVISLIHHHFPAPESETIDTTINISQIATSNNEWNQIPDSCTATLDIRINHEEYTTIVNKIKSLLPEDVAFEVVKTLSPFYTNPQSQYISSLTHVIKQVTGNNGKTRKTYGGSDASFFSEAGLDAIEFGPVGHGQHHDNEWVDIESLGDYYQILKNFLLSIK